MSTEIKKPVTLISLKEVVDRYLEDSRGRELTVCIPNNKGGMGGTSVTNVVSAHRGIDWDSGKFFIYPEVKMIERPPDFTESKYQEAIQRIKSLEGIVQRFVDSVDDPKELGFAVKMAKNALEIFKKKIK